MPNISPKQFNLWYRYLSYSCGTHIITCHNVCSKEFLTVSKAISSGKHPFSWHLQNNWYYSQHDRVTSVKSRKWHWVASRPFQWVMIVIPKNFTQGFSQFMYMIWALHYSDVIMSEMASQITSLTSVYSTVYSGADKIKLESSAAQIASNAEKVSIWWRHHGSPRSGGILTPEMPGYLQRIRRPFCTINFNSSMDK